MESLLGNNQFPATAIPVGGGIYSWDVTRLETDVFVNVSANPLVLVGDINIAASGAGEPYNRIRFHFLGAITAGVYGVTVFGQTISDEISAGAFIADCIYDPISAAWVVVVYVSEERLSYIRGARLIDGQVTNAKLATMTRGSSKVGNASAVPSDFAIGAANTVWKSDGTDPVYGFILNANIDAAAGIVLTKLANGTASYVIARSAGGVMQEQQYILNTQGGTGTNSAAASGIAKVAAGTWSFATIVNADIANTTITPEKLTASAAARQFVVPVSFEAGEQCNNTIVIGQACTISATNSAGYVTKAIAATDTAVVTLQKNGVNIGSATFTFAISAALNAQATVGAFAATDFAAGDTLSFVSAKTTAGGKALITVQATAIS